MAIAIRRAVLTDLSYIVDLQKRNSEQIGFITRGALEGIITGQGVYAQPRHRIWTAQVNGDLVGFLYASPGSLGRSVKIIQVCLQEDARRYEYGTALVHEAERWATSIHRCAVACSVATDIEARAFWDILGYELRARELGGTRRRRILERRYKWLPSGLLVVG